MIDTSRGDRAKRPDRLGVFAAGGLASLALAIGLACWAATALQYAQPDVSVTDALVEHSYQVLGESNEFVGGLASAEAAVRGFLLTREPDQAAIFERRSREVAANLANLERLTADDAAQQAQLTGLRPLLAEKLNRMRRAIGAATSGPPQDLLDIIRSGEGFRLMLQIRGVCAAIIARERDLLRQRQSAAADARAAIAVQLNVGAAATACLFLLAVTSAAVLFMRRQRAMLIREAEALREHEAATLLSLFRTKAELAETRGLTAGLFESSADPIIVLDPDGHMASVNPAARNGLGIDINAARDWISVWPPMRADDAQAALTAACDGKVGRFAASLAIAGRAERWWDITVTPIGGPGGVPERLLAVARDVTLSKRLEIIRGNNEARLRSIVETAGEGIIVTTGAGRIVSANSASLRMFGLAGTSSLIGRDISSFLHHDDESRNACRPPASRFNTEPWTIGGGATELRARRQDGTLFPIEMSVTSFTTGSRTYCTVVIRDVTARERAEAELRDSETRRRLAMRAADIGVWEFDYDRRTVRFDDRASALADTLLPANQPVSLDGAELAAFNRSIDADHQAALRAVVAAVRGGSSPTLDLTFRTTRTDGTTVWLKSTGVVVEHFPADGHAKRMVGVLIDVTQSAESEARLERLVADRTRALEDTARELRTEMQRHEVAQEILNQKLKMEALGQLTGGIMHDCNNVLGAIAGMFELIEMKSPDADIKRLAGRGDEATRRALGMIEHLLAFSRQETLQPACVDIAELLARADDLLRHAIGPDIVLDADTALDLWPVLTDRHRLEVALINLAVNARDAMEGKGVLTIRARNLAADAQRQSGCPSGDCVVVSVSDTGSGMPPEVLARVLEPFFTTKDAGKGTGLGLSMVHGFATQSNGALYIQSLPGVGTTIDIILPRHAAAGANIAANHAADAGFRGKGKILVVDDDEMVRALIVNTLREFGYAVVEAGSAEAAYALARASPDLDLVLTDVVMSGADGATLAARLRADFPDLPIVFVTGYSDGHNLRGEKVLAKPFARVPLVRLVAEGLGQAA